MVKASCKCCLSEAPILSRELCGSRQKWEGKGDRVRKQGHLHRFSGSLPRTCPYASEITHMVRVCPFQISFGLKYSKPHLWMLPMESQIQKAQTRKEMISIQVMKMMMMGSHHWKPT
ncbi:hypothetical protein LINPERHAP2_LOCUS10704 [Linum perenne]